MQQMRRNYYTAALLVILLLAISFFVEPLAVLNPYNGVWSVTVNSGYRSMVLNIPGLYQPVNITIDSTGLAHISAANDHDLFFAQGFYVAANRLDQMELQAIMASGNLSKYVGPSGIASDKTVMLLGLPKYAYSLEKDIRQQYPQYYSLIQDFSDGVNAYINSTFFSDPLVLKLAGIEPFKWTPYYSFVWQEYMSWTLTTGGKEPLMYSLMYSSLGFNSTLQIWPYYPYYSEQVTVLPGDGEINNYSLSAQGIEPSYLWSLNWMDQWATGVNTSLLKQLGPLLKEGLQNISDPYFASPDMGSNSWVIASSFSCSGSPLLANDPHLPLYVPSLWIPMQLQDTSFNVTGWNLVGVPGILIGHTASTAWGLTTPEGNSANDYLEILNGTSYLYDGKWLPMQSVNYTLDGKEFTVYYTNNGPLIARNSNYGISLSWLGAELPSYDLIAEIMLDNSTTYSEMLNALRFWGAPPQNFALVSKDHAGYITAGRYPLINETLPDNKTVMVIGSRSILNGSVSNWEPEGFVPFKFLPQSEDNPRGYMFAPNQPTVGQDYPYPFVGGFWASGGRAQVIYHYLSAKQCVTINDMESLQSNITDYWASQLTPLLIKEIHAMNMNDLEQKAFTYLSDWNYTADEGSVGMTLYWYITSEIDNMTYAKIYQENNLQGLPLPFISTTIYLAYNYPDSQWFNYNFTNIAREAFTKAVDLLSTNLGDNVSSWTWGRVHMLEIHSLSGLQALSIGPLPIWGDDHTLSVGSTSHELIVPEPYVTVGSSLRFIASPALQQFLGVFPGGPSNNPISYYYSNQLQAWLDHQYFSLANGQIIARWHLE